MPGDILFRWFWVAEMTSDRRLEDIWSQYLRRSCEVVVTASFLREDGVGMILIGDIGICVDGDGAVTKRA